MQIKYIDIHSHLNLSPLHEDIEAVVLRMHEKGVATFAVGTDYDTSKLAIEIAEKYPDIALGVLVGLHPNDNDAEIFDIEKYRELAKNKTVIGIGECGIDYFRISDTIKKTGESAEVIKEKQKEVFKQHIELAQELSLPLMIHARPSKGTMDTYEEALDILESYQGLKCNFHFFVGNIDIAKRIIKNGWTVSFDGPITFARDYDEVIRFLPLESIMAETDAPFAAPMPYRGKTCEPWMVEEVIKKIAEIKGENNERVSTILIENARKVFPKAFI